MLTLDACEMVTGLLRMLTTCLTIGNEGASSYRASSCVESQLMFWESVIEITENNSNYYQCFRNLCWSMIFCRRLMVSSIRRFIAVKMRPIAINARKESINGSEMTTMRKEPFSSTKYQMANIVKKTSKAVHKKAPISKYLADDWFGGNFRCYMLSTREEMDRISPKLGLFPN